MTNLIQAHLARAVIGAAFLTLVGACADMPSSLPRQPSNPKFPDPFVSRVADLPILDAALPPALAGESVRRRDVGTKDGARYTIESLVDATGLPREMRVLRDGRLIARLSNEWMATAAGIELQRQRFTRFVEGHAPLAFDSRDRGGVSTLAQGSIVLPLRSATTLHGAALGAVYSVRLKSVEGEYDGDGGPCDAEASAVEEALDDWMLSVLATGAGVVAANPVVTWTAFAYQVRMYRNVVRKEAALDECVETAGLPGDEE